MFYPVRLCLLMVENSGIHNLFCLDGRSDVMILPRFGLSDIRAVQHLGGALVE
jgi:hypothetical protein